MHSGSLSHSLHLTFHIFRMFSSLSFLLVIIICYPSLSFYIPAPFSAHIVVCTRLNALLKDPAAALLTVTGVDTYFRARCKTEAKTFRGLNGSLIQDDNDKKGKIIHFIIRMFLSISYALLIPFMIIS